jgi:hypothetical protein
MELNYVPLFGEGRSSIGDEFAWHTHMKVRCPDSAQKECDLRVRTWLPQEVWVVLITTLDCCYLYRYHGTTKP